MKRLIDFLVSAIVFMLAGAVGTSLFLFSAVLFFGHTITPISKWMDDRAWAGVECTITHSSAEKGYTYYWQGETYTSIKYDHATDLGNLHEDDNSEFREGSKLVCFVNPNKPEEAIVSQDFSWSYFAGLIAIPPMLFSAFIVYVYTISPIVKWCRRAKDHTTT